jgi:hypothetical protein
LPCGVYSFDNVAPGTYIVSEELRSGWNNITPSSKLITVASGETTTVDFGNVELGRIVVWKYYDWNMNGVFDGGDETMKGWSFSVYDAQGTELKTVTTNAYGENVFYDLVVGGTYEVREALQDGWFNTTPANQWVTINRCGDAQVMFGNIELGTISGYKYNDLDMDQAKDENENGLAGWTIELYLNDVFVKSTITDESGAYCFEDLKPGNYDVREVMQKDWFNVSPTEADVEVVPSGEYTADFYNVHGGYIDGYKFYDYNINGRWDENSNEQLWLS